MQATSSILMVRPVNFAFNEQTAESNAFQVKATDQNTQEQALKEFDAMVHTLRENEVDVIVINDTPAPSTPDSIFPNNWISLHGDGSVYLYPMQAENRRQERRADIINSLKQEFRISGIKDLSYFEDTGKFLEGTGSMVLDRDNKIAYACLSPRTNEDVIKKFCELSGYTACCFQASDENGKAIYHTNVMMCVGEQFAVICMEAISDKKDRLLVSNSLKDNGKETIEISYSQMNQFAGNMLQVKNRSGESLLIMSARAFRSLSPEQTARLSGYARIVCSPLQAIENNGGGSARCMIAEIHLPKLMDRQI